MRRRAREISLRRGDEGLPLLAAHDEIHRLGSTLNKMLARIRASFEREPRSVAEASHELRTLIAVIKTEPPYGTMGSAPLPARPCSPSSTKAIGSPISRKTF